MTRNKDRWIAIAVLAPSVVLLAVFVYGFIFSTFMTSLTDSTAVQQLSRRPANFIGFKNYIDLFSGPLDNRFRIDMTNTVFFTILFIIVCLSIGLLLAILLDQKVAGEGLFRTIFLFPMALSFVVTGTVWKWLFNPTAGINALPTLIGLPPGTFRWFTSQERVLEFNWQDLPSILITLVAAIAAITGLYFAVKRRSMGAAIGLGLAILAAALVFTGTTQNFNALARAETHGFNLALIALLVAAGWQMSGYTMAMYLAGLRGVPEELREAARVDGCSEVAVYRRIVLPLLAPITLSAVIILGHISLKIFDLVYVMGGGDNLQIDMPGLNMFFETFRGQNFGRGAAIAMVMLILVALVIVPYLYNSFKGEAKRS
ncbi:MAG: sugar ABC transporter permease [Anaerolinea sp.]|nr:sugar ABC transporter permease [Anaerolinea sp.]